MAGADPTAKKEEVAKAGVGAIIRNAQGQIIMGKRKGSHGSGTWALPGGKLSVGETWFECAERETLEETSLKIKAKSFVAVTNDIFVDEGKHFVTLYILCEREDPSQQPVVAEVDKCEEWAWISWDQVLEWYARDKDSESRGAAERILFLPMHHLVEQYSDTVRALLQ